MTNMTLVIPQELMSVMKKHKEIKWSQVARQTLMEKAEELKLTDQIVFRSNVALEPGIDRSCNQQTELQCFISECSEQR